MTQEEENIWRDKFDVLRRERGFIWHHSPGGFQFCPRNCDVKLCPSGCALTFYASDHNPKKDYEQFVEWLRELE